MAVEFTDHAASAYIAQDKGWFEEEGLKLTAYESYVTGMALAAALARGDIQVADICLVPAINAYANAGVPIKVVAGTHKYGYGLVVNPDKIKTVKDLEKPDIRIGCVEVGGAVDVVLHKMIDKYGLDEDKVLNHVQRMNPPKQVLAIKMGQLDAIFLPEHWATMAEEFGFKMLLTSQDVWPEMQGSVLVVKDDLINSHPDAVRKLVEVTKRATEWSNQHPQEAAEVMARQLQAASGEVFPAEVAGVVGKMEITPEVLLRSMSRLKYTTDIDPEVIQETIDYLVELGYIKKSFSAEDILDLRYLQ
jgi:NitT/TauT family transport system substrate-binding protein